MPRDEAALWADARKRALLRGLELTRSRARARELVDEAIAQAVDPERRPWNPAEQPDLGKYLCSLVWSLHGTELASYAVTHKDDPERAPDASSGAPSSRSPERLLAAARTEARATRCYEALLRRVQGDHLVLLLLEHREDDDARGDEEPRARVAEPPSTRAALAAGYTLGEVKNARERLKRHALQVAREQRVPAEGANEGREAET